MAMGLRISLAKLAAFLFSPGDPAWLVLIANLHRLLAASTSDTMGSIRYREPAKTPSFSPRALLLCNFGLGKGHI
jgi:hypothetical protein